MGGAVGARAGLRQLIQGLRACGVGTLEIIQGHAAYSITGDGALMAMPNGSGLTLAQEQVWPCASSVP